MDLGVLSKGDIVKVLEVSHAYVSAVFTLVENQHPHVDGNCCLQHHRLESTRKQSSTVVVILVAATRFASIQLGVRMGEGVGLRKVSGLFDGIIPTLLNLSSFFFSIWYT